MNVAAVISWVFVGLAFAGAAYAVLAAWFVARSAAVSAPAAAVFPAITIFKPLHGAEPALNDNLESFFCQNYPGPFQVILGLHTSDDAAAPIVEALRARHPEVDSALIIDERRHGTNPKVANLINMQRAARHDIWLLSDSDIAVAPDYLGKIAAALEPENVGAVTCLYTGWAAAGFVSRLSAMGVSYQFLPNVVVGLALKLATPCFGSTIAIKGEVLRRIGGLEEFASQLADDHAIGAAVRAAGYRVDIPSFAVRHAATEKGWREWFEHELRWMRTIRSVDPAGHAGSLVTHAFPLSLLGLIAAGFGLISWPIPLAAFAATLLARAMLKWRIDASFAGPAGPYWLLPVRDVLSFVVFLTSLFGASVVWQNERLRVHADGALSNR